MQGMLAAMAKQQWVAEDSRLKGLAELRQSNMDAMARLTSQADKARTHEEVMRDTALAARKQ